MLTKMSLWDTEQMHPGSRTAVVENGKSIILKGRQLDQSWRREGQSQNHFKDNVEPALLRDAAEDAVCERNLALGFGVQYAV